MSKITFSDVVALAKAGYKYSEVKELLSMSNDDQDDQESAKIESKTEVITFPADQESKPETEPETVDYKSLYESEHKKVVDLQNENSKQAIEDDETKLDDVIKNIKSKL